MSRIKELLNKGHITPEQAVAIATIQGEGSFAAPVGAANWHDHQRRVALECFRIVQGPGDAGSEAEFNCRRETEQSGWMRLAARIIDSQNDKLTHSPSP